jgi:protein subunit release factor B
VNENGDAQVGAHITIDSNAKRHTSFASVPLYPLTDDSIEEINPADISWDFTCTFRVALVVKQ